MLAVAYNLDSSQWAVIDAYTRELEDKLVATIGAALGSPRPGRLSFGRSDAGFAKNRRTLFSPNGPVDHDMPVLRVDDSSGRLRAVVFGYACHNTTIGAEVCKLSGDYAGFCQAELRRNHPGAEALFVAGCGADANPYPRGSEELARAHGSELSAAVDKALSNTLQPLSGPLRASFERVNLAFASAPSREELEHRLEDRNPYIVRHARNMLAILDRDGKLPADYPYPIQVWQFGKDLTWIALGGEVVVDYDLRLKKMFGADRLWVSGYSNDVMGYIPSLRVLKEGGYEGSGAMIYYVRPGPWSERTLLFEIDPVSRDHGAVECEARL
jgi:hypothetical protein